MISGPLPIARFMATAAILLSIAATASAQTNNQPTPSAAKPSTIVLPPSPEDLLPIRRAAAGPTAAGQVPAGPGPAIPGSAMDSKRVAVALAVVLGLILFLRWLSKGMFNLPSARSSRAVQVLSRSVLAPKQQVMLIRVGRRVLVVADSGTQMNSLCEITDPDEIATLLGQLQSEKTDQPIAKTFSTLFGRAKKTYADDEENQMPPDEADENIVAPDDRSSEEITGLMDKVRLLSSQFRRPEA